MKRILKQTVRKEEEKSEILAIPNQYKNMLDEFIDSSDDKSDIESLAMSR